ncbi:MAG: site-specific DNA-methyltransferase [Candidatus Heimdallarchaeota archaeon]|nr:site-specific DNA-methyltransferase [Candidatus Heimdallarchaeota archaeon]
MTDKLVKKIKLKNGTIYHGDCLTVLKSLPSDEIVLAFTSPPYFNAINYKGHVKKLNNEIDHWEREEVSYASYKQFLIERFKELYRVIRPGGYNIVNISPTSWKGKRTALAFHFAKWMEDIGWEFREDIIWEKSIARDRRSGVLIQHPYPGYYYPSLVVEYNFVFQKPANKKKHENIYWFRSEEEKKQNEIDLTDYQGEMSKNLWKIRPVAPQENIHPCPFPIELPKRIIEFYSYKGDKVIDIFMGSGQTCLAALELGRKYIGIDTEKKYVEYTLKKLKEVEGQSRLEEFIINKE